MAYRTLRDGDLVRVVGKGQVWTGSNAIVIDAGDVKSRVQLQSWQHMGRPCSEVICETVLNKNLLVRDDPYGYIVDGRIDHDKKARLEALPYRSCDDREHDFYDYDDRDDDDKLIMQQLLDRVAKLEKEMLEVKWRTL